MQFPVAPRFPYIALVRVPLLTIVPIAVLFVARSFGGSPLDFVPVAARSPLLVFALLTFAIGALTQGVAVPVGLLAVYRAGAQHSMPHNASLFCGVAYFGLFVVFLLKMQYLG